MAELNAQQLVALLGKARWHVAARTFGNNHATLIGILVDCWVSADPAHSALEGAPSFKKRGTRTSGSGICDALLCEAGRPVGLVEVEGGKKEEVVQKVGHYFEAQYDDLSSLEFAVCLFYAYAPAGRGLRREYPLPADKDVIGTVIEVSRQHPTKLLAVIELHKSFGRSLSGIRARSEYYSGHLSRVQATVYRAGEPQCSATLFQV